MKLIQKFKKLSRRRKIILILFTFILVLLISAVAFGWFKEDAPPAEPPKYYSQLTGVEVPQDVSERSILGVMIENSEEARPQTGLDSAGIVFETVTEGGITRYLALYQEHIPKEVGPVRSLRPAFVNWLMGFDASVAHVGGSATALHMVEQLKTKSLSQFNYTEPYRRVDTKMAPHNMYASTDALRKLQEELNFGEKSNFSEIPRSEDAPSETPQAKKITIDFSGPLFIAEFRYDKQSNSYKRFLAGEPHIDEAKKKQISVKNLVVIKINGNHSDNIQPIGGGEAFVFKDGGVIKARWEQKSGQGRIKIIDDSGNEVSLNRGDTWVSALPNDRPLKY